MGERSKARQCALVCLLAGRMNMLQMSRGAREPSGLYNGTEFKAQYCRQ